MPSHDRLLQSRFTRRQALLTLAATAAAPALASSFPRPALAQDQVTLTLVAYSTPREAYEEIIPLFQAHARGRGRPVRDLLRGLRRAEPGRRGRAAGRYRRPLPRAGHHPPHRAGSGRRGLECRRVQGHGDRFRRRPRRSVRATRRASPPGTTCCKEGVEVITPNPLTSGGARWNIMAAWGAQLAAGQDRGGGHRVPAPALHPRPGAGQERARVAGDLRRRQGRCPHRLRERGDHRPAEGRSSSSTSFPIRRFSSRTPSPSSPNRPIRRRPRPSSTSCARRRRSASSARRATARSCRRCWQSSTYPTPPTLFTIADLGGWAEVTTQVLRSGQRHRGAGAAAVSATAYPVGAAPAAPAPGHAHGGNLVDRHAPLDRA